MQTSRRVSQLRWRVAQAVEVRWWRRYLGNKEVKEYRTWKDEYWRTFLSSIHVQPPAGSTVLDAGCGPAGVFTVLPQCVITAVDPLLQAYSDLPHFDPAAHTSVRFEALPLESFAEVAAYDYVFCLNVINHVRDLPGVLQVLAKAVKSTGTVVLSVDAHRHGWLKPIFRAIPGDVLHPHQMSLEDYEEACTAAGLSVVARQLYRKEFLFDYWVLTLKPEEA